MMKIILDLFALIIQQVAAVVFIGFFTGSFKDVWIL